MIVSWEPYVWDAPHPVAPGEFDSIEQQWGVTLPDEYKNTVSTHQGMTPNPHIIDIGKGDSSALTGSGEYVCFDYRDSRSRPKIVFVTVETFIYPVADSFSEFLDKLHD